MSGNNPYRWEFDQPSRRVSRDALYDAVTQSLLRGLAVRVVGGRGTGKSVLLRTLQDRLATEPDTRVVRLVGPPPERTEAAALYHLAGALGIDDTPTSLEALIDRVCPTPAARLVLLLDEADAYVQRMQGGVVNAGFVRTWTNRLESQRREQNGRLGVVIAGGLGLFYLAHELGSALVSRAETVTMQPFTRDEVRALAAPFAERGGPLDDTTLETLYLLSGGQAALVTYGLQHLWPQHAPDTDAVRDIFGGFRATHPDFVRQVWASISERGAAEAPRRALREVHAHAGAVPLDNLRAACAADPAEHRLDPAEALRLLEAGGLVHIKGAVTANPIAAWPIASIFTLPEQSESLRDPLDAAAADVTAVLCKLVRFSLDFSDKQSLFEERVYSGVIAAGLLLLGWHHIEREPNQKGGRVDIKLAPPGVSLAGHIVVEVKRWENRDRAQVQQQVRDYQLTETLGGIVVMIAKPTDNLTPKKYEAECLAGLRATKQTVPIELLGRWQSLPTDTTDTFRTVHLVVELPRRRVG